MKNINENLYKLKIELLKKCVKELPYMRVQVSGNSMEPTICDGEIINIKPVKDIKIKDILWFVDDYGKMALHRVIELQDEKVILVGDNAEKKDQILRSQILGKAALNEKINDIKETVCIAAENDGVRLEAHIVQGKLDKIQIMKGSGQNGSLYDRN